MYRTRGILKWKLSENVNETMDTDQKQTLLGINQGKYLQRLTSDVMNQKVSPNDLAESQELVKLDNTLKCINNTLRSTWERQGFGCSAWITLRPPRPSYLRETGNVRWTYECRHRIIESFRSDMSYSLCQVCSTLYPGNAQASFNSSLAAPEVCWKVSQCAKDWETMGEIVDRHSDWASSDKVSEKPWWSYKRQRHDWKCAATVIVQHTSLAAIHDAMTSLAGKHHIPTYSACAVRRGNAIALLARPEQMYRLVWFTWSMWWQCTAASFSIQRVGSKCDETEKVVSEIQERFDSVSVRNATIKETSDGAHPEWVEAGVKVDKATVQIDPSILFLRCRAPAQRDNEDSTAYFAHGMMAVPTSLFRDFFLRKVDKSVLGREIKKNMRNIMADYATCDWWRFVAASHERVKEYYTCRRVGTVQFLSQGKVLTLLCGVWWVGRAINQMSRTQSSSDWKCVSSNYCDSWKCTSS